MLVKVSATRQDRKLEYVFRFGLPPSRPGGEERGVLRLPLPKNVVSDDCTFLFGRLPLLYPRYIRIVNKTDVYVDATEAVNAPINGVWKVFVEVAPPWSDKC